MARRANVSNLLNERSPKVDVLQDGVGHRSRHNDARRCRHASPPERIKTEGLRALRLYPATGWDHDQIPQDSMEQPQPGQRSALDRLALDPLTYLILELIPLNITGNAISNAPENVGAVETQGRDGRGYALMRAK